MLLQVKIIFADYCNPAKIKQEKLTNKVCWDIILKLIERRSVPILKC